MTDTDNTTGKPGESGATRVDTDRSDTPALTPRVLLTWVELTAVGLTGGVLGASVGGPPGFIVYLATSLLSIGVLLYNVNELVKSWLVVTPSE